MTLAEPVLRQWVAQALSRCCDGRLTTAEIMTAGCSFLAMGVDSIALVRLVDAVENEFDVLLDGHFPEDLDSLAAYLTTKGGHG
jgi:acyl carrier protein